MHRLDRRIRILRGKREGAFDKNQYVLELAFRARASRKVRMALRAMRHGVNRDSVRTRNTG